MCGIMGFVGKPKDARAADWSYQLASKLLAETVVRGSHATGVYVLLPPKESGKKDNVFIYKLDAPSTQFVRTAHWKQEMKKGLPPFLLLGHCRFYTHGSPQDHINNHPHFSDDKKLALVHNGVISGYAGLKDTYHVKGECDSEVLLRIIETEADVMEGIKKVFRVVSTGSMACMVSKYDSETKKAWLYLFRNDMNPIVMIDLREELGQIFFASTKDIAEKAMKNAGMPKPIQKAKITEIPAYSIWKIPADTLQIEMTEVKKPDFHYPTTVVYGGRGIQTFPPVATGTVVGNATTGDITQSTPTTRVRALIDTIVEGLTEIDEKAHQPDKLGLPEDKLEGMLKEIAWEIEQVVNPAINSQAQTEGGADANPTQEWD